MNLERKATQEEIEEMKKAFRREIEENNPLLLRINKLTYDEVAKIYHKVLEEKYGEKSTEMDYAFFRENIIEKVMFKLGYIAIDIGLESTKFVKENHLLSTLK